MLENAEAEREQILRGLLSFSVNSAQQAAFPDTLVHMPREILVDWTTPAGGGFRSVLYFDAAIAVAGQRAALATFLGDVDAILENDAAWSIESTGRDVDSATGTLLGLWSDSTPYGGTGGVSGEVVADATQMLFRWETGVIINGRFVTGRTFIPGLDRGGLVQGNLSTGLAATLTGYANTLAGSGVGFSIWHRPQGGSGGFSAPVDSGICMTELAVLRRRRK
jgi:hypothetical protein